MARRVRFIKRPKDKRFPNLPPQFDVKQGNAVIGEIVTLTRSLNKHFIAFFGFVPKEKGIKVAFGLTGDAMRQISKFIEEQTNVQGVG